MGIDEGARRVWIIDLAPILLEIRINSRITAADERSRKQSNGSRIFLYFSCFPLRELELEIAFVQDVRRKLLIVDVYLIFHFNLGVLGDG